MHMFIYTKDCTYVWGHSTPSMAATCPGVGLPRGLFDALWRLFDPCSGETTQLPHVLLGFFLVGGLEHVFFLTFHILGMTSSQLTFIFFRGKYTTSQFLSHPL